MSGRYLAIDMACNYLDTTDSIVLQVYHPADANGVTLRDQLVVPSSEAHSLFDRVREKFEPELASLIIKTLRALGGRHRRHKAGEFVVKLD